MIPRPSNNRKEYDMDKESIKRVSALAVAAVLLALLLGNVI